MVGRIVGDTFEQLAEIGKSTVQQAKQVSPGSLAKTAMEQVSGSSGSNAQIPPGLEDLKQAKKSPPQLAQKKQQDSVKSKKQLDATRLNLNRLIKQRYERIQSEVLQAENKRESEPMQKQQEEMITKAGKQKKEEAQAGPVKLPSGPKPKGSFGSIFTKQKQGTGEVRTAKVG